MDSLDQAQIKEYLTLEHEIKRLERRKKEYRKELYQGSFCTQATFTGFGISVEGVRPESFVLRLERYCDIVDVRIAIAAFKLKHWRKFYTSLSPQDQEYLKQKILNGYVGINDRLENKVLDEIEQIQIAVSLWLGIQDEDTSDIELVEGDFMANIDTLLDFFGD